jgi:hypothetical protein
VDLPSCNARQRTEADGHRCAVTVRRQAPGLALPIGAIQRGPAMGFDRPMPGCGSPVVRVVNSKPGATVAAGHAGQGPGLQFVMKLPLTNAGVADHLAAPGGGART